MSPIDEQSDQVEASGANLVLNGIKSSFISTALTATIQIEMQVYI